MLLVMLGIIIGVLIIIAANTARGAEFAVGYDKGDTIYFYRIYDEPQEELEVDIKEDEPLEHYQDRELMRQEEDIEDYWEEDYRDYLRSWDVDENMMGGW